MTVSKQKTFDTVAKHLLTQNQKSFDPDKNICRYRYGDLKCAVGCLIPDSSYHKSIEGFAVGSPIIFNLIPENHDTKLLDKLQELHDTTDVSEWRDRLRILAASFHLDDSAASLTRDK